MAGSWKEWRHAVNFLRAISKEISLEDRTGSNYVTRLKPKRVRRGELMSV